MTRFLTPGILLVPALARVILRLLKTVRKSSEKGAFLLLVVPALHAAGHRGVMQEEGLGPPGFWDFVTGIYEKEIVIGYFNPNKNSQTEIWISRSPDDGFVLARVEGPAEGYQVYYDDTRSPRTKYYFKLRAIRGDLKSDFSRVTSFTTGSEFFPPEIQAEATDSWTIKITFYDRSYNDVDYVIQKEMGPGPEFWRSFSALDSGHVFHFTDELLEPNQTYIYRVDAYTQGPNMPRYLAVASVTVQTPPAPVVYGFALIDADRDVMALGDLTDGAEIYAIEHPNLMAFTNQETESVVFTLNGRKRTENVPPYAYFYDINGDFKSGKLAAGAYELSATPYAGNNGTGKAGITVTVRFTVRHRSNELEIGSFTLVDPATGVDIGELRDHDEVDVSAQPNIRANAGSATSSVVFFLNGAKRTENEAPYAYFHDANGIYKPGRLTPGNYVLEATAFSGNNGTGQAGRTATIRFTVVGESTNDNSASLHLYPNPATNAATLELSGAPHSRIVVEVADALGERYNPLYQGVMHDSGSFKRELDLSTLQKGNYFLMVRIDEKVFVKRFAVKK